MSTPDRKKSGAYFGVFPKLLFCFLLVALIPLVIFAVRGIRRSKDTVFDESRKILLFRSTDIADRVSDFLYMCVSDLRTVADLPRIPDSYLAFCVSHRRLIWRRVLRGSKPIEVHLSIPVYREIAFIGPEGREKILIRDERVVPESRLRNVSNPANTTYKSEDYFLQTKALPPGEIYVSHVTGWHVTKEEQLAGASRVEDAINGKEYDGVVRFAMPVYDEMNTLTGIVMIALDHRHLMEFTQHIVPLSERPVVVPNYTSGNYAYMFDDEGWIITHPKFWDIRGLYPDGTPVPPYHEGKTSPELEEIGRIPLNLYSMAKWRDPQYLRIMNNILSQQGGMAMITNVGYDHVKPVLRARAYAPILFDIGPYEEYGVFGGVTLGAEIEAVERIADSLATELWMILILTAVAVILIAILFARSIAKPVLALSDAARRIGAGDLDPKIDVRTHDELGHLAETFNRMCAGLKESRERLRRTERFASIGEVISGTAHAIKTELNIYGLINNMSALDRLTPPDDPRAKYVKAVKEGVEGLEQVVHALLEPLPEISPEPVDFTKLVNETIDGFDARFKETGVQIERDLPAGPVHVAAQTDLLRQVLNNVVKNALDAMPDGGRISFGIHQEPARQTEGRRSSEPGIQQRERVTVVLDVSDSGCGIPERFRNRVFFPFFTTKKERGGTGLGLYHCSRIIRQHGGEMELKSREGKGTTVTIRLPSIAAPEADSAESVSSERTGESM